MIDDIGAGRRPVVLAGADTSAALRCCPGAELEHPEDHPIGVDADLLDGWGPVLEVWEGHATDRELRYSGSSGGVISALGLHGVMDAQAGGVIHIRQRDDIPLLNETVLSSDREGLLRGSGSRYAPASPCDSLDLAVQSEQPVVFIGKPCDVAATRGAERHTDELRGKIAVTIALFCAGAPSTAGTLEMLDTMNVDDVTKIDEIRYRGNGWPGEAAVQMDDGESHRLSYAESWGRILQKHRPWRCRLCIDHTGEFADIAVGDPWYREIEPGEPGSSLVVVRTERGQRFIADAIAAGHVELRRVDHAVLPASQPNLLGTRGAVWGRIATSRLLGVPVPRYRRMPSFTHWIHELTLAEKVSSIGGTAKRILQRRLHRRRPVEPADDEQLRSWTRTH